jgi:hypothetical protein
MALDMDQCFKNDSEARSLPLLAMGATSPDAN